MNRFSIIITVKNPNNFIFWFHAEHNRIFAHKPNAHTYTFFVATDFCDCTNVIEMQWEQVIHLPVFRVLLLTNKAKLLIRSLTDAFCLHCYSCTRRSVRRRRRRYIQVKWKVWYENLPEKEMNCEKCRMRAIRREKEQHVFRVDAFTM